jgi:hypothetical protein
VLLLLLLLCLPYEPQCPAPDQVVQVTWVEVQHGPIVQAGSKVNQSWPLLRFTEAPGGAGVGIHLAGFRPEGRETTGSRQEQICQGALSQVCVLLAQLVSLCGKRAAHSGDVCAALGACNACLLRMVRRHRGHCRTYYARSTVLMASTALLTKSYPSVGTLQCSLLLRPQAAAVLSY